MVYAIVFTLFGLYLGALAFLLGGPAWLLLWPALSFVLLGVAYAGAGPRLLGKRPDGSRVWWAAALFLPYLLLTGGIWHLQRCLSREPCCNELAPGLWGGRRPCPPELPDIVTLVVDLTAEFREPAKVRSGREYRCLPVLDASVPSAEGFRQLVEEVANWPGGVYVHCALGHGRTGMFVAAVLIARGLAARRPRGGSTSPQGAAGRAAQAGAAAVRGEALRGVARFAERGAVRTSPKRRRGHSSI